MNTLTYNGHTIHFSDSELSAMRRMQNRVDRKMFHFLMATPEEMKEIDRKRNERRERNGDNLKWAYIMVGGVKKLAWVDNVTMKAYKADRYAKTNIEIKRFTFVRWCTSMDL